MLGAALAAYDKRVAEGQAAPPQPPSPQPQPPSLSGLHISAAGAQQGLGRAPFSQSLPSGNHLAMLGKAPPKPRLKPSDFPRNSLSALPILELPEPSPHSSSLLGEAPVAGLGRDEELNDDADDDTFPDDIGGTCAISPTVLAPSPRPLLLALGAPLSSPRATDPRRARVPGDGGQVAARSARDARDDAQQLCMRSLRTCDDVMGTYRPSVRVAAPPLRASAPSMRPPPVRVAHERRLALRALMRRPQAWG